MKRFKALITTVPFAAADRLPIDLLDSNNINYLVNPLDRKLTEDELADLISDFDVLIAGTESISRRVISRASRLKHISRVGIGLDNVDLAAAKEKGIRVSYTPDAPAPAVAELTVGLMLTLLRSTHLSNELMHKGGWHRFFGRRLSNVTVGIIGVGRIGQRVIRHLQGFGPPAILVNDISSQPPNLDTPVHWVDKETIYKHADVISLHLPLTNLTTDLITVRELNMMKNDALLINTSRGGIVNERDLHQALQSGHIGGAAVDVFEKEPYTGKLCELDVCLLSAHMGSMSVDCRTAMEITATEEVIRFLTGEPLKYEAPDSEYYIKRT